MEHRTDSEKNGVIETFTGIMIDPFNPKEEQIVVLDIAHALSNLCRFAGHCNNFYSVAEHSVACSMLVPKEHALSALLHDSTEAYMVDIPTPIKNRIPIYIEKENSLMEFIYKKFDLEFPLHAEVVKADKEMLITEFKKYKGPKGNVETMTPREAKKAFIDRYTQLTDPNCES